MLGEKCSGTSQSWRTRAEEHFVLCGGSVALLRVNWCFEWHEGKLWIPNEPWGLYKTLQLSGVWEAPAWPKVYEPSQWKSLTAILTPRLKKCRHRRLGPPWLPLPLFARFKAKTEASSLTCEILAVGPSMRGSQFQYLWRVEVCWKGGRKLM